MDKKLKQGSPSQDKIQAKPVLEALGQPDYPTQSGRWGKAASGAATFFLAITIGGCAESQVMAENVNPPAVSQQAEQTSSQQQAKGTIVAPIFEHGDGRGSTGCVAVCPPAFLSEEEAMQIIKEELDKHGIKLGKGGELEGVEVQMLVPNIYGFKEDEGKKLEIPKTLNVDAKGIDNDIAIEFVSKSDLVALREEDLREERIRRRRLLKERLHDSKSSLRFELELELSSISRQSTVSRYNMKEIAEYLAKEAADKGDKKLYLGVFYDPTVRVGLFADPKEAERMVARMKAMMEGREIPKDKTSPEKKTKPLTWEEREKLARSKSKEQLRQQVHDFAAWLGEQGVEVSKKD